MRRNLLKYLDYASYIALLVATVLVVVFEISGNMSYFKFGLYVYEACFSMLIIFTAIRIYSVFKKNASAEDATFAISTKQKVVLFIKLFLILVGFCLTTLMIANFK